MFPVSEENLFVPSYYETGADSSNLTVYANSSIPDGNHTLEVTLNGGSGPQGSVLMILDYITYTSVVSSTYNSSTLKLIFVSRISLAPKSQRTPHSPSSSPPTSSIASESKSPSNLTTRGATVLSTGAIAGVVAGVVALLILLSLLFFWLCRRRDQRTKKLASESRETIIDMEPGSMYNINPEPFHVNPNSPTWPTSGGESSLVTHSVYQPGPRSERPQMAQVAVGLTIPGAVAETRGTEHSPLKRRPLFDSNICLGFS
jgi:hypothetical protein